MANLSMRERIMNKVRIDETSGCWIWTGYLDRCGYGAITWKRENGSRTGGVVHRALYKELVGELPDALHLDHLCRVRHCVNPDHLEPVTARTNVMRSTALAAINARKTHCKRGHAFDEANTYVESRGFRSCKACHATREKARRARR